MIGNAVTFYERLLRRSMDVLGVSESVERKILAAVGIQFGVAVLQAVIPFVAGGRLQYGLVAAAFLVAAVAFANTVLIARRDVIDPLTELRRTAGTIGRGQISDAEVPATDRRDEIADLVAAFEEMESYLSVVTAQSRALARQEFDADVLDEDVPGEFGDSLDRMATELREYTEELESVDTLAEHAERLDGMLDAFEVEAQAADSPTADPAVATDGAGVST